MLHGVPWFLLGSLWAVVFCEYRAFLRRQKIVTHVRVLESELMNAEDQFMSARADNDHVRAELLDLLAEAQASRTRKASQDLRHEAAE